MRCIWILILFFGVIPLTGFAQIGGEHTYRFLSLTHSARVAALGGHQVALSDTTDLNLPYHNPSLLHNSMSGKPLVNYVNYLADVNYGYASYAMPLRNYGTLAAGIHYINYGSFTEASEEGEITGNSFNAAEYALNIIWSNSYRKWKYGINIKPVLSSFESYQSAGIAFDAGISRSSANGRSIFGMAARNFGKQITTYYENGEKESLPFDLLAGFSHKLAYAPVVLSVTAHSLNSWNLARPDAPAGKKIMRHLIWGAEIFPSPNFTIRAGYNYHLRQELKVEERLSTVGFSLGFGLKIKRFRLDYATTRYHVAGSSNHFSLAFNISNPLH